MMFFRQPEMLSSINMIQGAAWNNFPLTLIYGSCLLLAFFVLFIKPNFFSLGYFKNTDKRDFLAGLLLIAWLPLYLPFLSNNLSELSDNRQLFGKSLAEKKQTRFCRLDQASGLGGEFCNLLSFSEQTKNFIPAGATVSVISNINVGPFVNYEFGNWYQLSDQATAAYLIFYQPEQVIQLLGENLIKIMTDQQEINLGRYQLLASDGAGHAVLKKLP